MSFSESDYTDPQKVLDFIIAAARADKLAVMTAAHAASGEKVRVLVAHQPQVHEGREGTAIFPLAMLFTESPFEVLEPPEDAYVVEKS